jgi:hypothetical protein
MAATGFTPISLYYSATTTNVPLAANLTAGELALNTADGKLFYKDSSNVVQVIGTKGGVGSSATTQVLYNSAGLVIGSANMTFNGTTLTSTFSGAIGATTPAAGTFTTATATASTISAATTGAFSYGTLSFSDTGLLQSAQTSVNSYAQNAIQNTSIGAAASSEFIAYNDGGTATTNYVTVGINSSTFAGTGPINAAGYGFLVTGSTDLVIGTIGANNIHFAANSFATDAITINSANAVIFPTLTANTVLYLNASKAVSSSTSLQWNGSTLTATSFTGPHNGTVGATTPSTGSFTVMTASADSAFTSTGAVQLSVGTTAQRPTGVAGKLRFNSDLIQFEGYTGTAWASVGGATLSNDTTTATFEYPLFASATSGSATTVYTSNAKLLYKPSTGELQSSGITALNGLVFNANTLVASTTVATGFNAQSVGPFTVPSGLAVTVSSGSRWVIL